MNSVKIVFFIGDMFPGGAERQLVYLCNGLSAKGHAVTLLTLKGGEAYSDLLSQDVNRHVLKNGSSWDVVYQLFKYLRKVKPDVLVNFLFHAALLGRVAAFFLRLNCITSHRNVSYGRKSRDLLVRLTERMDRITLSNVEGADDALAPLLGKRSFQVIPNVFLPLEGQAGDQAITQVSSDFRWCFLGRLEQQKNLPVLLETIARISQHSEVPLHLDIAGSGRLQEYIVQKIAENGLEHHVTLHGQIDNPQALLAQADAFVLPSRWEGMPNVLMEAMAIGLPCVATPVGAVPDMLRDGRGVLANGTGPEALEEAMQTVMSLSESERRAMGRRAATYIKQECGVDAVIDRWETVLKQAAES